MATKFDIYETVTNTILKALDKGVAPWRKPWSGGAIAHPKNLISKKKYRGINIFLLGMSEHDSCYWLTYKQAQSLNGNVKKGEKGTMIVFWKFLDKEKTDDAGKKSIEKTPMLRYYKVFNACQCENITIPDTPLPTDDLDFDPIAPAEGIYACMPDSATRDRFPLEEMPK